MPTIETRYIGDEEWRFYSLHLNWSGARAQQSVDRLNRISPKTREYRVAPPESAEIAPEDLKSNSVRLRELDAPEIEGGK